jgi:dTDP-4-amino-4,6-dideoxygalactose transaminase
LRFIGCETSFGETRGVTWTPAICGGKPAFPAGPPSWPKDDAEIGAALGRAVADGSWGKYHGPNITALEAALRRLLDLEYVLPCCSGTAAVEIGLRGLGIGPGDEVLLGAYDFPGNFRAIEAVGALPVLVDLDPGTRTIDPDKAAEAWTPATRALIASHLHGGVADMPRLVWLARERGGTVLEDACQMPGAVVAGRPAGSWGDVGVLSFGGSKLLTAGRGGAVVTSRGDIAQRAKIACQRGNHAWPLSELQAAVLVPQLERLPERHAARLAAATRLLDRWNVVPGLVPADLRLPATEPAYYKLGFLVDSDALGGFSRAEFIAAVRAEGIAVDAGFRGFLSRSSRRCRRPERLPVAEAAAASTVLLHHPLLLEAPDVVDRAAETVVRLADLFRRRAIRLDPAVSSTATETGADEET